MFVFQALVTLWIANKISPNPWNLKTVEYVAKDIQELIIKNLRCRLILFKFLTRDKSWNLNITRSIEPYKQRTKHFHSEEKPNN